jgi:hypothetical protein
MTVMNIILENVKHKCAYTSLKENYHDNNYIVVFLNCQKLRVDINHQPYYLTKMKYLRDCNLIDFNKYTFILRRNFSLTSGNYYCSDENYYIYENDKYIDNQELQSYFIVHRGNLCDSSNVLSLCISKYLMNQLHDDCYDIYMNAVKIDGTILQFIKCQNENICLEAVKQNGMSLKYVINKTYDICIEAVHNNYRSIMYLPFNDHYNTICKKFIDDIGIHVLDYIKYIDHELTIYSINKNQCAIRFIKNNTEEECIEAITLKYKHINDDDMDSLFFEKSISFDKHYDESPFMIKIITHNTKNVYIKLFEMNPFELIHCIMCTMKKYEKILIHPNNIVIENSNESYESHESHESHESCDLVILTAEMINEIISNSIIIDKINVIIDNHAKQSYKNIVNKYPKIKEKYNIIHIACMSIFDYWNVFSFDMIDDMDHETYALFIQCNGENIKYIKNKTYELCIESVKQNGDALKYIDEQYQTEELCLISVKSNGKNIRYVKNKTHDLCIEAVKNNGMSLKYIDEQFQTEEICINAVKHNGIYLKYVINKTYDICEIAIKNNGNALNYVHDQYKNEDLCMEALKKNELIFQYIKHKTDDLCLQAVKTYGGLLEFVDLQTDDVCIEAIKQYACALQYVKHQTENLCAMAVNSDYNSFIYVKNKTYDIAKSAIVANPIMILYIDDIFILDEMLYECILPCDNYEAFNEYILNDI